VSSSANEPDALLARGLGARHTRLALRKPQALHNQRVDPSRHFGVSVVPHEPHLRASAVLTRQAALSDGMGFGLSATSEADSRSGRVGCSLLRTSKPPFAPASSLFESLAPASGRRACNAREEEGASEP